MSIRWGRSFIWHNYCFRVIQPLLAAPSFSAVSRSKSGFQPSSADCGISLAEHLKAVTAQNGCCDGSYLIGIKKSAPPTPVSHCKGKSQRGLWPALTGFHGSVKALLAPRFVSDSAAAVFVEISLKVARLGLSRCSIQTAAQKNLH